MQFKIIHIYCIFLLRGGWDRLGLYMKGAPRKVSREKKISPNRSLDDLTLAASNIMLTLKADQESYDIRFETQVVYRIVNLS